MKRRIRAGALVVCAALMSLSGCAGLAHAGELLEGIVYTGTKSEFVAAGSEVFSQVDSGLPGDVFVGNLAVTNASQTPCEVYVCAKNVVASGPGDMLDRISFTLGTDGNIAYEGALSEASVAEPVSLGILPVGQTLNMDCMAVIPSELTNEYADAAVGMNMVVNIEDRESEDATDLVQTGGGGSGGGSGGSGSGFGEAGAGLIHAGDVLTALPFVLGALAAVAAVIWCAWKRRMRMW